MLVHQPTTSAALAAIRAAQNYSKWGAWAARRYAAKRGAAQSLVTLCRVLEAAKRAGLR